MNHSRVTQQRKRRVTAWQLLAVIAVLVIGIVLVACQPVSTPAAGEPDAQAASAAPTETVSAPDTSDQSVAQADSGAAAQLEPAEREGMYDAPPEMTIDPDKYYYATIRTEKGDIKVQLFADRAPETVNNFVFLAREGYYNDTTFHRVIEDFMAQAGDPAATGAGGPGYTFEDEFYPGLEFTEAGLLAMANRGPGTNGSQFFITLGPTEWLNGLHTIFGKVIEGQDVLDEITRIDPETDAGMVGDTIYGIDIEESDESILPTPTPAPPTPTPLPTPTPFAPTDMDAEGRPMAEMEPAERSNFFNTAPTMVIDEAATYTATISTTQGDLVAALYADKAPVAVNNFVVLANLGFFDGTPINIVRPDDSLVFGSPDNLETSDAGYDIPSEMNDEIPMQLGIMTNLPSGEPVDGAIPSSSSQVLVALIEPPAEFAGMLGFFGTIAEGQDVMTQLTAEDTIESITITSSE